MDWRPTNAPEFLQLIADEEISIIGVRFVDTQGRWRQISLPSSLVDQHALEEGIRIRHRDVLSFWPEAKIDLRLRIDATTAFLDPFVFVDQTTALVTANIEEDLSAKPYIFDTRAIIQRAEKYLAGSDFCDRAAFAVTPEFYTFSGVRFDQSNRSGYYYLDSDEAEWSTGAEEMPNLGHKIRSSDGAFRGAPENSLKDLQNVIFTNLDKVFVTVDSFRHGRGSSGQSSFALGSAGPVEVADNLLNFKYVVKCSSAQKGCTSTFMPNPLYGEPKSHIQTSLALWKDGVNIFTSTENREEISMTASYFIGGLLKHAGALLAFCAPTTNSYKQSMSGTQEQNVFRVEINPNAGLFASASEKNGGGLVINCNFIDSSANPNLAIAALIMAGADGIENKIQAVGNADVVADDVHPFLLIERENPASSLKESCVALSNDCAFLTRCGVMSKEFIDSYIREKLSDEIKALDSYPHPQEYKLYFDI